MTTDDKKPVPIHIGLLSAELRRRQSNNPRYSLRGFAEYLEMHPSALSRILKGKQTLSLDSAVFLLKKLNMSNSDRIDFASSLAREKLAWICNRLSEAIEGNDLTIQKHVVAILSSWSNFVSDGELVDFLVTPGWQMNATGLITKSNESFRSVFAIDENKEGKLADLIHQDDRAAYLDLWTRAEVSGTSFQNMSRLRNRDGTYTEFSLQTMPLKSASREVIGWLCIIDPQTSEQVNAPIKVIG